MSPPAAGKDARTSELTARLIYIFSFSRALKKQKRKEGTSGDLSGEVGN